MTPKPLEQKLEQTAQDVYEDTQRAAPRPRAFLRVLQPLLERLLTALDQRFSAFIQPRRRRAHCIIMPYVGWGTPDKLQLTGRVLLPRTLTPPRTGTRKRRNLLDMLLRMVSREVAGMDVTGLIGGQAAHATSDADGFFQLEWSGLNLPTGWHQATLQLEGRGGYFPAQLQIIDPRSSRLGIISDLDDTVIKSDVTSLTQMLSTVLLGNAHTRLPFPGVSALYRALKGRQENNPIFYVSSSPWNIFDFLWNFLQYRNIPLGPLFLRNWGEGLFSGKGHTHHKLSIIEELLSRFPQLPFVLIGDSGEQDPEIYAEVVRRHPQRILAVYIRDVSQAARDLGVHVSIEKLAGELQRLGVPMLLARDSLAAASHAFALGLISAGDLRNIMASLEKAEQQNGFSFGE